eukprot:UN28228
MERYFRIYPRVCVCDITKNLISFQQMMKKALFKKTQFFMKVLYMNTARKR